MTAPVVDRIRGSVATVLAELPAVVLAVSGGMDSMVLLDAAAATVDGRRLVVATFDHGTGRPATRAARSVVATATDLGIAVSAARAASDLPRTEAAWRRARWDFIRGVASNAAGNAAVATAHIHDDQIETVLMRAMRGAGARGLAGLSAAGGVVRPLLGFSRAEIAEYAADAGVSWVDDPSNQTRAFARNRVRLDILPALRAVRPEIDSELIDIGRRAAEWRHEVEQLVVRSVPHRKLRGEAGIDVASSALAGLAEDALGVVWPPLLTKTGIVLDRRGSRRLAEFTVAGRAGSAIQLSGGWQVHRARDRFEIRRARPATTIDRYEVRYEAGADALTVGGWALVRADSWSGDDLWSAWLPCGIPITIRRWRPADAIATDRGGRRKVKQILSRAGITGFDRPDWPVVVAGNAIVWIPGVRRTAAATPCPGIEGLPYRCERRDL